MYNKVELCGVNTAELPVLSEQEKRQLLTRARAGDQSARQSMIEGNLRLVLSVVQRFAQRGENLDDLFQVGCIGLTKTGTCPCSWMYRTDCDCIRSSKSTSGPRRIS